MKRAILKASNSMAILKLIGQRVLRPCALHRYEVVDEAHQAQMYEYRTPLANLYPGLS